MLHLIEKALIYNCKKVLLDCPLFVWPSRLDVYDPLTGCLFGSPGGSQSQPNIKAHTAYMIFFCYNVTFKNFRNSKFILWTSKKRRKKMVNYL